MHFTNKLPISILFANVLMFLSSKLKYTLPVSFCRLVSLSEQQQLIVNLVQGGHNVYFGGVAGSGKTYVAKHVLDVLSWKNKKFACMCTPALPVPFMVRSLPAQSIPLPELDIVGEPKNSSCAMCWPIRNAPTSGD